MPEREDRLIVNQHPTLADKETAVAGSDATVERTAEEMESLAASILEDTPEEVAKKLMAEQTGNANRFFALISTLFSQTQEFKNGISEDCLVPISAMCALAVYKGKDDKIRRNLLGFITKASIGGKTVNFKDVVTKLLTSAKKIINTNKENAELIETVDRVRTFFSELS